MNNELIISPKVTIIDALQYMDQIDKKLLIVCINSNKFIGVLSIGDIQRAILRKRDLSLEIETIIRKNIVYASIHDDLNNVRSIMLRDRIECMPIIDDEHQLVDILEWETIFGNKKRANASIDYPVIIMAGGKGTRLKPITNIIPKPLIPISDKTIIEEIIDRFADVGVKKFYVSVNYKADVIRGFFENKSNDRYSVQFIDEEEPLGTAGSLAYLKEIIKGPFFVTNCDILVDVNIEDLIRYHKHSKNIATIVSVIRKYHIPYGMLETHRGGVLVKLIEKPTINYQVNSGLYLLEPDIFAYINDNEYIDITDVFNRVMQKRERIGVFPVSEGSWVDIGNWDEYIKIIEKE